jgi:predicted amidophosphoribosyltransferase
MVWLLLLALIGMAVGRVLARIAWGQRGDMPTRPSPNLKECPGCGARLSLQDDACPQCGLRISI